MPIFKCQLDEVKRESIKSRSLMETIRADVNNENCVAFLCPHCQRPFDISVREYKNIKHELTIHCSCKVQFRLLLNFRRFRRKNVILVGEAKNLSMHKSPWTLMTVLNLSMGGLRFRVLEPLKIQNGDKFRVRFTLDSPQEEIIDEEVIVRHTKDDECGCEFISLTNNENSLKSYLNEPIA